MDMLKRVEFVAEATCELRESVRWYEAKSHGLGLRFTVEIDSTVERIRLNPDMYLQVADNIRRIQMNKFPFSVFYTTEGDTLVILRIFHNKRKPVSRKTEDIGTLFQC